MKAIADYIGQEYTHGGDIRFMVENLEDYCFIRPPNPDPNAHQFDIESWKKQLDLFWKRRGVYEDNKMKLYSLVWGQSSKSTQSKIETHLEFQRCKNDYANLKLIKIIREFVFKSDERQYKYKAEDQAKRNYYNLRQTSTMTCQEYFEKVRNVVEVIKSLGGSLCDPMHFKEELPNLQNGGAYTEQQMQEAKERILDKTVAFLVRADRDRYGKLIKEIENDFLKGHDNYPKTPTEAYNLLVNYRNYVTVNKRNISQGGLDQVAFITEGKRQKVDKNFKIDKDFLKFPNIKCFKCGQFGHYKSDYPEEKRTSTEDTDAEGESDVQSALMTMHVTLAIMKSEINPMWILCDNESTVDIFKNKDLITNIRKSENPIKLKGTEGNTIVVDLEGDLLGYGNV